jgi:hypothetical protein
MSSPKFERVKQLNPGLSDLLDRLGAYVRDQTFAGQQYIVPKLAAARLGLKDGEAFVLLELLAREKLLRRVYNVYCTKTNVLIATVDSLLALDQLHRCDDCDTDHDSHDLKVEVAFKPRNGELLDLAA